MIQSPQSPNAKTKANSPMALLLGFLCWSILLTLLAIPLSILLLSKCLVLILASIFRKDLYSVSTGDAAFTIGATWEKSKLSVGLLCHVQGHLELDQVQERFSTCLLEPRVGNRPKYDKLFSCLVTFCGYVFRKTLSPDQVNLNELIYERRLKNGESLEMVTDSFMDKSYGKYAPAWELMVIPMSSENTTVIAFKMHHVFCDGYSLLHILDILTGSKSPYLVKDTNESCWKMMKDVISLPFNLKMIFGSGGPTSNPIRVNTPQKRWIYTFTTIDLEPIKIIRRKYDVHFATVILSLIVGSIRQFLLEQKTDDKEIKLIPSHLAMANTLPCEQHPSQAHVLCNHWSLGMIKSPISVSSPLERVLETEEYFQKFHSAGLQKVAVNYAFPLFWLFPQWITEKSLENDIFGYNCGLTSLVGANDYKLLDKPVIKISPLLNLIDSNPFTVFTWFTFSHANKLDITLAGAPDIFQNRNTLSRMGSDYFLSEYRNLCLQCGIPLSNS